MIDKLANQFAGRQCDGEIEILWHDKGPRPLHGWYWRGSPVRGPFNTSRDALVDAINNGHVYESGATK